MAVQLSHTQGAYVCGICSFTSPDHRILVKHLIDHSVFKEKKHEHILWCGLCKPLTDANYIDGQQHAMTNEDTLVGSEYRGNNDLGYGDARNYYSGYNGLYNPYAFSNAYFYPVNVPYENPCYVNGYYQSQDAMYYTDDFYNGKDIHPSQSTPQLIEPAPENKYLDAPHNSKNTQDVNSISTRSDITLSDIEISNDYNSLSNVSSFEPLSFESQNFPENSLNKSLNKKSSISETDRFAESITNDNLNVQTNEFGTISTIEPQPEINESSIKPVNDKNISRKLNNSQVENLSSKVIPKCNTVKQSPFQTIVLKNNDRKNEPNDIMEPSNFEFLSEVGSIGVGSGVDTKSAIKTNSVNMKANPRTISGPNKESCLKLPPVKLAESFENDLHAITSSTKKLIPEAACIEKIATSNATDDKNCSIGVKVDTLSKIASRKKSNSQRDCEQEISENCLINHSISAQGTNIVQNSDARPTPAVDTTALTKDASDTETGSIDVNITLTKFDLNEIHSERPIGKLEKLPKVQNSILSENDSLISTVKLSPKMNVTLVRGNSVSDIKIKSIGMYGDLRKKKDKVLGIGNKRVEAFERDIGQGKDLLKLKIKTCEDAFNRNYRGSKDDCNEAKTESSKKCQSDKTVSLSNVKNGLQNSCRSDLNKNSRSVTYQKHIRLTYSEVVKRGLPIKSSG